MVDIEMRIKKVLDEISDLRIKRHEAQETFYGAMCDYEI